MATTLDTATEHPTSALSFSNADKTATIATPSSQAKAWTVDAVAKSYIEATIDATGGGWVGAINLGLSNKSLTSYLGDTDSACVTGEGNVLLENSTVASGLGTIGAGGRYRMAVDRANNLIWFALESGDWNGSGTADPATGTGGLSISGLPAGDLFAAVHLDAPSGAIMTIYPTVASWVYGAPSGFSEIGATSLPESPFFQPNAFSFEPQGSSGAVNVSVDLTGVAGTGAVGTATANGKANTTLTGVAGTGAVGTAAGNGKASTSLTGVAGTGAVGTATANGKASTSLTGVSGTGQVGSVTVTAVSGVTVNLTGVSGTGAVGTATATGASVYTVTGVAGTGQVGSATANGKATAAATGVSGTGQVGTATVTAIQNTSTTLTGVSGTGQVGDVSVTAGGSVSVNLTGVSGTGAVGTAAGNGKATATVTGVSGTGQVGSVTVSLVGNVNVNLTGVSGTGAVGTAVGRTNVVVALTGVGGTSDVGSVTASGKATATLTGVAGTASVGSVVARGLANVALTGVGATGYIGTVGVTARLNATVNLTGLQANAVVEGAYVWGILGNTTLESWTAISKSDKTWDPITDTASNTWQNIG
jgi:hypothetical protein